MAGLLPGEKRPAAVKQAGTCGHAVLSQVPLFPDFSPFPIFAPIFIRSVAGPFPIFAPMTAGPTLALFSILKPSSLL